MNGVQIRYWCHRRPLLPSLMTCLPTCHQSHFHCHFSLVWYPWKSNYRVYLQMRGKLLHLRVIVFSRSTMQWQNYRQKVERASGKGGWGILLFLAIGSPLMFSWLWAHVCVYLCVHTCVSEFMPSCTCVCLYVFEDAFVCVNYEGWNSVLWLRKLVSITHWRSPWALAMNLYKAYTRLSCSFWPSTPPERSSGWTAHRRHLRSGKDRRDRSSGG